MAKQYIEDESWFTPLSEDQNVLPGEHAYSHLNSLCSAMQSYLNLNEERYLRAARNGFRMIEEQSFATGGWGPNETFREAGQQHAGREPDQDARELRDAVRRVWTLQDHALSAAGDARTAATATAWSACSTTRILGAKPLQPDGHELLLLGLQRQRAEGLFRRQVAVLLGNFSAGHGGLWHQRVHAAWPGCVREPVCAVGAALAAGWGRVHADADDGVSRILAEHDRVDTRSAADFAVLLRIPAWAGAKTRIAVNGRAVDGAAAAGDVRACAADVEERRPH